MTTKRTVDIITEAFSDVMSNRRKYELELTNGKKIDIYFPPVTRYDRQRAQTSAGTDDALMVSTQLLCQLAQNEDGSKAFALADAIKVKLGTITSSSGFLTFSKTFFANALEVDPSFLALESI